MRLEPFSRAHDALLGALLGDPDMLRLTRIPEPPPPASAGTGLERYEVGRREGTKRGFAVPERAGSSSGSGSCRPSTARAARRSSATSSPRPRAAAASPPRSCASSPPGRSREGIQRCELIIAVRNLASERVAERAGYVREGYLRSVHHKQGKRDDVTVWSRLPSDPDP